MIMNHDDSTCFSWTNKMKAGKPDARAYIRAYAHFQEFHCSPQQQRHTAHTIAPHARDCAGQAQELQRPNGHLLIRQGMGWMTQEWKK